MPLVDEERLQKVISYALKPDDECEDCPLEETDVPCPRRLGYCCKITCADALYNYLTKDVNENLSSLSYEQLVQTAQTLQRSLEAVKEEQEQRREEMVEQKFQEIVQILNEYFALGGRLNITDADLGSILISRIKYIEDGEIVGE